jgi:hypothetical protein
VADVPHADVIAPEDEDIGFLGSCCSHGSYLSSGVELLVAVAASVRDLETEAE